MKRKVKHKGFSLAEVLMALGILSIGMLLIAAVFPAGIHFTTIATERTIASAAADEAFAKIRMYCNDPNFLLADVDVELKLFPTFVASVSDGLNPEEFVYPSASDIGISEGIYFWSAVWRKLQTDPTGRSVQVTVFVSRKAGANQQYWRRDDTDPARPLVEIEYPVAVDVEVLKPSGSGQNELQIVDNLNDGIEERSFINAGGTIVDGKSGRIYRVLDRSATAPDVIILDRDWLGGADSRLWVVPPPVGGGRYPAIAVYQKVIRF